MVDPTAELKMSTYFENGSLNFLGYSETALSPFLAPFEISMVYIFTMDYEERHANDW